MLRLLKWALLGNFLAVFLVAVIGYTYQSWATTRDLAATAPPGQFVDVGGHRLHLWCVGTAKSGVPPVLFDSGIGGDAFDWTKITPQVAQFTQACTFDRAGMGYSDPGPMPRTSARIAEDLAALLRNSGVAPPAVLVGLSFGGYNTRIVASDYPELVSGLVLVSASHEHQGERYATAGIPSGRPSQIMEKLLPIAASLGILRLSGTTLGPPPSRADPGVREYVQATVHRASRYQTMASELAHTRESGADVAASRRLLDVPLVVVSPGKGSGRRAEINAELQRDMTTISTRACQVIADDSGHGIGNRPELVIQAIRDVIRAAGDGDSKPGCE